MQNISRTIHKVSEEKKFICTVPDQSTILKALDKPNFAAAFTDRAVSDNFSISFVLSCPPLSVKIYKLT